MKQTQPIQKLLIANRGEIVSRIASTARARAIPTVSIYTEEDKFSSFIFETNEAYQLSKSGYEGYTSIENIIHCAQQCGANAIHPGYGFLAESPLFAQKVIDAGLVWIGPHPQAIELMGNKSNACRIMNNAGIPIVPGFYFDAAQPLSKQKACEAFKTFNSPALLKAAAGGGGKGLHCIRSLEEFDALWDRTAREAQALFNSTELLLEKYIADARHVEVQIAGDGTRYIHLFERECSIQRRHQKLIEEAPCQFITPSTREQLYTYALQAAKTIKYDSIGTVEFLITADNEIYFLEMNTRIQVEHPITETITGIDLVALQLDIATSKNLRYQQSDISLRGHSIECRIIAEDPMNNFIPSTGTLHAVRFPHLPFIRIDHALEKGNEISPSFDSMIAKVISYGETREKAITHMVDALNVVILHGILTNISLLITILSHNNFKHGTFSTQWLEKNITSLISEYLEYSFSPVIASSLFLSLTSKKKNHPLQRWNHSTWK